MSLRNIAIIAHVDHGKTTLVDCLLRHGGLFRDNQLVAERALDHTELERERGITILAKCTSVPWGDLRINIVDTPGHADFGGEVERILGMVDGALVLVDAAEGPMPQTKFVLTKALAVGLRPIVVVNKTDRADARPFEVQNEMFDLFAALGADDAQLDFPTLFASAKEGWAAADPAGRRDDMGPLCELVARHVPAPAGDADAPFRMLASLLEYDPYLGRILIGRIAAGRVRPNTAVKALSREGRVSAEGRITKLLAFRGLERVSIDEARAGDIVAIAGLAEATVPDTICAPAVTEPLAAAPIDPPTIAVNFSINDAPLAGTEGDKVTSRVIRERLKREADGNVAIRISDTESADTFEVAGRGELQIAVLVETMRREGFELALGRPRVLYRADPETGARLEPIEEVVIDVDQEHAGTVVEALAKRRGELRELRPSGGAKQRIVMHVPSRGLIGYFGEFMTATRGTGLMASVFLHYAPFRGRIESHRVGRMISVTRGAAVAYAPWNLEARGRLFVRPGDKVYPGMIIGESSRGTDLEVNPLKAKQLTNMRAAGKDDAVVLTPPLQLTLEQAIAYIGDDELVEVTPSSIRLRKRHLAATDRRREARRLAAEA